MRIALLLLAMAVGPWAQAGWFGLTRPGNETKAAVEYYVAPYGNDRAMGSRAMPFQTLGKAQEMIREMVAANALPKGGVCVFVREGTYSLPEGFLLDARDSGTAAAPITWRAFDREAVRLVGGRSLPADRFQPVKDKSVLARLSADARKRVRCLDLNALGIKDLSELPVKFGGACKAMELFYEDEPMQLARWPNEGWVTIKEVIDRGSREEKRPGTFVYSEDEQSKWDVSKGVWLHGYWCHDWAAETIKVGKIDPTTKRITLAAVHNYGIGASHSWNKVPRRYYALNLLDELDAPGEWFLDAQAGKLYFWPPSRLKDKRNIVLSTTTEPVLALRGTNYMTVQGFTVEAGRSDGIQIAKGDHNLVAGCTLRNTGGKGVSVSGENNGVVGCDVYQTGTAGITLFGGDRHTLKPGGNYAENNHIHDFARLQRTYAAALHLNGVGNRASHNLIHDCPHAGILYGGNNQLIEYNEIFNTCLETGDVGALYTGRSWGSLGNVIQYNFIHDIGGMRGWSMGVYLDDCDSGDTIHGNIFYKVRRAAFIGGGRYNNVTNNVFVDCSPAVHLDSRGKTRIKWNVGRKESWDLQAKLEQFNYKQPPWSTAYPYIVNILDDDPALPKHNRIENNICVAGKWLNAGGVNLADQVFKGNRVTDDDPGFADPEDLDFQFRRGSIIWDEMPNFKRIPTDKIGLYRDDLRASWPVDVERPVGWDAEAEAEKKAEAAAKQRAALPVYKVAKANAGIDVDGNIRAEEWRDAGDAMTLAQNPGGGAVKPASSAWLMAGKEALYVAIDNPLGGDLHGGTTWGKCDAVEVAVRGAKGIVVLRGFSEGTWESSTEGGLSKADAAAAAKGVRYAARKDGKTRWTAEWEIPWSALGLSKPSGAKVPFNLTVRKVAAGQWLMWQGTGGWSWQADKAGLILLP
jgi:hypothetical protein